MRGPRPRQSAVGYRPDRRRGFRRGEPVDIYPAAAGVTRDGKIMRETVRGYAADGDFVNEDFATLEEAEAYKVRVEREGRRCPR